MAFEQPLGAKSLMKGKLYQSSEKNWDVSVSLSRTPDQTNEEADERHLEGEDNNFVNDYNCVKSKRVIDFLNDDKREMTYGRRIALSLMNKTWYNPKAGDETEESHTKGETKQHSRNSFHSSSSKEDDFDAMMSNPFPNLEKSWAYFEHVALYRYLVSPDETINNGSNHTLLRAFRKMFTENNKKLERAEPGENDDPTRLYSPIFTPHSQLGDFGLGIGLYFSTLRAIAFITFIAGLVSVYNIVYFASSEYQPPEFTHNISMLERGSAICTHTTWVPCVDCNCSEALQDPSFGMFPADRCATDAKYPELTFVLHNECDGTPWQLAACSFAAMVLTVFSTFLLSIYLKRQEVQFDLDEQTAQDYSVKISNPPKDAKDPDEWFRFFNENFDGAHATVVTIAVDNDLLVRTLVERRERLRTICDMKVSPSMHMLDLARVAVEEEKKRNLISRLLAIIVPGLPELFARVVALNAKVEGLAQLEYPVTNVFVTFETEKDQRNVLSSLSVGSASASRNDTRAVSVPNHLFRGKHVLKLKEPDEPSTVRWQDLNAGQWQKVKERFFTFLCTIAAIVLVAVLVGLANKSSTLGAAFTIAAFNTLFPMMAKMLTDIESHPSEGSKQTSLYFKICVFRWVSTAVVISIITPFTHTLTNKTGLITQVYALFFADIVTTNALQLADPVGHLKRHFLAPRAATQDAMNLLFQGTPYELAERYTDMTKILFLCLWYSGIFPGSFFLCSFSLGIKYYVDRFSLMRTWKRAPQLGNLISRSSRRVFFPLAIVAQAILSSYYWTGFPYDNICPNDGIDEIFVNTFTLVRIDGGYEGVTATFTNDDVDYRFCNMDMMTLAGGFTFPFVPTISSDKTQPEGWMTKGQIISTTYYGWSAIVILGVVIIMFLMRFRKKLLNRFRSKYKTVGEDQGIQYSEVTSRSAYIPQVTSPLFPYPLVACNTDNIDEELYDWTDPERTFRYYDLTKDAKNLLSSLNTNEPPGFSLVKHFPPQSRVRSK